MREIQEKKRIHFIGVGGISMSALAKLMQSAGMEVSGSDAVFSPTVLSLAEAGMRVWVGSQPCLLENTEIAVFSSAVPSSDPEVAYCRLRGIPVYERNEFLRIVSDTFKCTIAVGGTHGKTTATAMMATLLKKAEYGFCAHIGGDTFDMGNLYNSGDDFFLTEACEYKKSLLKLKPDIAVVLNAEHDHPDTYPTLKELYDTFTAFLFSNPSGIPLVCRDTEYFKQEFTFRSGVNTFGLDKESTFRISGVYEHKAGYYGFDIDYMGIQFAAVKLPVPGYHNVYNAAAAASVAYLLHIKDDIIVEGLEKFKGVKRRFEKKGSINGADIYHDYAHHPSEIRAVISIAKRIAKGKIRVVFQPHTFSRTLRLFDDFATCFEGADELIIVKEYAAREEAVQGADAYSLFKGIKHGCSAYCGDTIAAAKRLVRSACEADIILILGAGDIETLCDLISGI